MQPAVNMTINIQNLSAEGEARFLNILEKAFYKKPVDTFEVNADLPKASSENESIWDRYPFEGHMNTYDYYRYVCSKIETGNDIREFMRRLPCTISEFVSYSNKDSQAVCNYYKSKNLHAKSKEKFSLYLENYIKSKEEALNKLHDEINKSEEGKLDGQLTLQVA